MYKKIIAIGLMVFCSQSLFAQKEEKIGRGWLQYDDPAQQKEQKDLGKNSEKEILLAILKEQRKQTEIQMQILDILKVTNDLPEIIEVNGKKCLSNSSVDCFKMPIIKDAARIPVMKKWLEEPTIENALAYYKWQTKYLNQTFDVGYSLNLASISTPPEMSNIPSYAQTNGTKLAEDQKNEYIFNKVLKSLSKNMELDILLGKTFGYDIDKAIRIFDIYDNYKSIGVKVKFVFENEDSLNKFAYANKSAPAEIYGERWAKIDSRDKIISQNSFKDKDVSIYATPMYILRFNDLKKNIHFSQILGVGKDDFEVIFKSNIRALILFKVIKPKDINGIKTEKMNTETMIKELNGMNFINEQGKKEKAQYFKQLLEKEIKDDQK
ncbi:hypothetical protein BKH42_03645 [Helicobacter sp. 13S00482-2]|uniref:hypothetical protein n=1 Tax=Helicobacter sp. 13S00482-2 TaxID=1476200 RepID=UPI000BA71521|nr:hypothetical protein [Helicobacter sp. 13S00482-2]PAF53835.1 hypothetical protein BKH42_03645 [Helicobacter sp. 13S00482-2]